MNLKQLYILALTEMSAVNTDDKKNDLFPKCPLHSCLPGVLSDHTKSHSSLQNSHDIDQELGTFMLSKWWTEVRYESQV